MNVIKELSIRKRLLNIIEISDKEIRKKESQKI